MFRVLYISTPGSWTLLDLRIHITPLEKPQQTEARRWTLVAFTNWSFITNTRWHHLTNCGCHMMQRFRKFGALRAPLKAATGFKKPAGLARLSTWTSDSSPIVQEQPRDDGFKYFESEAERARNKLMEENFEKVLNEYRTSEARQTLILLLGMSENINFLCFVL